MATKKKTGETTGSGKNNGETYSFDERVEMLEKLKGRKLKKSELECIQPKHTEWRNTNLIGQMPADAADDLELILDVNEKIVLMPKPDLTSVSAVQQRLNEYLTLFKAAGQRPTVQAMGMALGYNRKWLYAVVNDAPVNGKGDYVKLPADVVNMIKRYYNLQEALWESWTVSGKLNPVSSIFIAKNLYGWKDRVENVMVNDSEYATDYNEEDITTRYDS